MRPTTAKDVTINLYWSLRGASQLLIPRYTPVKWWECDMWRLTNADFVDEYEIKMSVADFRADANKAKSGYEIDPVTRQYRKAPTVSKHDLLATDERGPNRFWFVIPAEMESAVEIPSYAGLLVFSPRGPSPKKTGSKAPRTQMGWEQGPTLQDVLSPFLDARNEDEGGCRAELRANRRIGPRGSGRRIAGYAPMNLPPAAKLLQNSR